MLNLFPVSPAESAGPRARLALFLAAPALALWFFRAPLQAWLDLTLRDERYACALLAPLLAGVLLVARGARIFAGAQACPIAGVPLLTLGAALLGRWGAAPGAALPVPGDSAFSLRIAGLVILLAGSFLLAFGLRPARAAAFPLCFLFLAVPLPLAALDRLVRFLQYGSADAAALLFPLLRIPALREGLVFSLPGFDIEIAEQCSGIRSRTSLELAGSVAGYLFLRFPAGRLAFVLLTVPVVIVRNALRIVTLSGLALYVSQGFLHGRLHRYGGLVFSLLDLAVLGPLLLRFRRMEERRSERGEKCHP